MLDSSGGWIMRDLDRPAEKRRRLPCPAVVAGLLLMLVTAGGGLLAQAPAPAVVEPPVPAAPAEPRAATELPHVHIIATGGTIAAAGYAGRAALKAEDLLEQVPALREVAQITAEDPITIGSSQITPEILLGLVRHVRKLLADDPGLAGIVITQGTDSLEETSFFFDLMLASDRPVVFTGAMRLPGELGSDGPRNLLNAVRLAASPAARGMGVLVTMNDQIHAAREIEKLHSSAVDAFQSPASGPLGYIDEGRIYLTHPPLRRLVLDGDAIEPRVDLITVGIGSDGRLLHAAVDSGAQAVVIEAFGRGNVPKALFDEIVAARRKDVLVVFTTRTGEGRVELMRPMPQIGVLSGEDLDGPKTRVLLIAALAKTHDPALLESYFEKLAGKS
jgi:L-asparaginase